MIDFGGINTHNLRLKPRAPRSSNAGAAGPSHPPSGPTPARPGGVDTAHASTGGATGEYHHEAEGLAAHVIARDEKRRKTLDRNPAVRQRRFKVKDEVAAGDGDARPSALPTVAEESPADPKAIGKALLTSIRARRGDRSEPGAGPSETVARGAEPPAVVSPQAGPTDGLLHDRAFWNSLGNL